MTPIYLEFSLFRVDRGLTIHETTPETFPLDKDKYEYIDNYKEFKIFKIENHLKDEFNKDELLKIPFKELNISKIENILNNNKINEDVKLDDKTDVDEFFEIDDTVEEKKKAIKKRIVWKTEEWLSGENIVDYYSGKTEWIRIPDNHFNGDEYTNNDVKKIVYTFIYLNHDQLNKNTINLGINHLLNYYRKKINKGLFKQYINIDINIIKDADINKDMKNYIFNYYTALEKNREFKSLYRNRDGDLMNDFRSKAIYKALQKNMNGKEQKLRKLFKELKTTEEVAKALNISVRQTNRKKKEYNINLVKNDIEAFIMSYDKKHKTIPTKAKIERNMKYTYKTISKYYNDIIKKF